MSTQGAARFELLETLPIGASVVDAELRVLHWNRRMREWTGVEPDAILGQPLAARFPKLRQPRYARRLRAVLEGGAPAVFSAQLHAGLFSSRLPDGALRMQETTVVQVHDDDGRACALISVEDVSDVSRRIAAYEALRRQAEAELEERRRAEEALARSNRDLEEFAAVVSHDLQAPARQVVLFGELLRRDHGAALDEHGARMLDRIINISARMRTLISDVLRYSKLTTNERPPTQVVLTDIMADVQEDLRLRLKDADAQLEVGPLPVLLADRAQMHQLFLNLVSNAVKFHRPGVPARVCVRAQPSADMTQWVIEVLDNGVGLNADDCERVFGMFARARAGVEQVEGTGVGLALCRKIVERHGGQITIAPRAPEHGTVVTVRLPILAAGAGMLKSA